MPPVLPAAPCLPHPLPIAPCLPPSPEPLGASEPCWALASTPPTSPPLFSSPAEQASTREKLLGGRGDNIRERKGGAVPGGSGAPGPGLPGFQLQPHPYGPLPSRTDIEGRAHVGIWRKAGGTGHPRSAPGASLFKPPTCVADQELCEEGWTKFQGHCYRYFPDRESWVDAESRCRAQQSHLSSIVTPEEQEFVNSECGGASPTRRQKTWTQRGCRGGGAGERCREGSKVFPQPGLHPKALCMPQSVPD